MKYVLKRIENDREVNAAEGDSLSGMRNLVRNSKGFFNEGYVIYEQKEVERYDPEFSEFMEYQGKMFETLTGKRMRHYDIE